MTRSYAIVALVSVAAIGCGDDPALEAELLVPDDLALHWDRAFNGEDDDRVALVPVDLMVYVSESGEPVVDAELSVDPAYEAVSVLPLDDVLPLDADDCDLGPCLWDAWRDRYVELLEPTWERAADEPLSTDANGLVRAYLLVDAFPEGGESDGDFAPVPVTVTLGATDAVFHLVPQ